ncbi:type I-E CRISPR-associated protein Cas6/Cse3/CasE [Nocardia sp. NPDC088792]|uniref:type I-E CRISPR-associated protein Cas6/Cse3/CasE n=1 Tax=Nocardia sp. NPDC088792 TaxID=3364332 RepID=UPI0038077A34
MTVFTETAALTKIVANMAQTQVRQDLRDIQRMHHVLTTLACRPDFGPSSRLAAGLLYRVEHTARGVQILMQSITRPDPKRLSPGYDIIGTTDLAPLLNQLQIGTRVRYRITANPTKSVVQGPNKRGKVQPVTGDEAIEWWSRKANQSGLELADTTLTATDRLTGSRAKDGHRSRLTIVAVTFEGTATVVDPSEVSTALLAGIGRGRAYGCGMLSVAPFHRIE